MFAILITEENVPKILQYKSMTAKELVGLEQCLALKADWYFISGYESLTGKILDWTFLPEHNLERGYDYDDLKIKTDWDQIVRK